jgi:divalent metal cation (Fe/Co/Zn/Cd) transporter
MSSSLRRGIQSAQVGLLVNTVLAITKLVAGVLGNAYALIADAVESSADIFSSLIVWGGLRIASRQADEDYPFGYGKAAPPPASRSRPSERSTPRTTPPLHSRLPC